MSDFDLYDYVAEQRFVGRLSRANRMVTQANLKLKGAGKITTADIKEVLLRCIEGGSLCCVCDQPLDETITLEHIVPGINTKENLSFSHKACNSIKQRRSLEFARMAWRNQQKGIYYCPKCEEFKHRSKYYYCSVRVSKISGYCKVCTRKHVRAWTIKKTLKKRNEKRKV